MRRVIWIAIPLLVLTGCGSEPPRKREAAAAAPVRVATAVVERTTVPSTYPVTGTVRAKTSATVAAKLMGYAAEVRAEVGSQVSAGQTLVILDSRDQQVSLRRAEAARDEAKAAIPEAEGAMAVAKSQVDLAQVTFNRMQELFQKRSVTHQEFDEANARLQAAQSSFAMARARRAQIDSKLAQAEQEVRAAGLQRGYTEVTAPFAGVVLTRSIEPGVLVVPGAPLFTLERAGSLRFEANVEESRLASIRVGQTAMVTLDEGLARVPLRVGEIVPTIDPASRTGVVKFDLPSQRGLRSGMFGRAEFVDGEHEVITVPRAAISERGQVQSVYVVDGQTARLRLVTLGASHGGRVAVLSGLSAGERVVSPIPSGLSDGANIQESAR